MASYSDLSTIIGEIRRAAIDAFMADQGWHPHFADENFYALWGFAGANSYTRPSTSGWGGGVPSGDASRAHGSIEGTFDSIRTNIELLTGKWLTLPDGSAASGWVDCTTDASAVFGVSGKSGTVSNSSEIDLANESVRMTVTSQLQGSFKNPFLQKYHTQLSLVAGGLGAACALLEMNYRTQAAMWPAAREDVTVICEAARDAFRARSAAAAAAQGKVTLTVTIAVIGAITSIATAGAAAPLMAVMGGLTLTATAGLAALDQSTSLVGNDYETIMSSFGDVLDKLNSSLAEQETLMSTMLTDAVSAIHSDADGFDLDAYQMPGYDGSAETIEISRDDAEVVSGYMWRIVDAFAHAEGRFGSGPSTNPTPRDGGVGSGADGTHPAASELYALTDTCLASTSAEYYRGKVLFDAAVNDYFVGDEVMSQIVDGLAAEEAAIREGGL